MELFSQEISPENFELAKKLLQESRAGFLTLFNNSPICMSMTSPARVYAKVNNKFLEKFGFSESEIIGRNSVEIGILDPEESQKVGGIIREKGRLHNDYVKCRAKDGTIVHTVSSIELMEMNGEQYLVSFFLDISKIVEQQAVIEQQLTQLKEMNKDLEAFSYSVSHDLRAPLRAIDGYTRILEEELQPVLDGEGRRILAAVQHNAKKMNLLIDDLLAFAKLGLKKLVKSEIDMVELFSEVAAELKRNSATSPEINIGRLHPANGDNSLIRQVALNLISNGIKYSSKAEHPRIDISSEIIDNSIFYTVKDNGAGFDMAYADKLFGVFQRLHSEAEFEGTGVGLAIVKRIINRHGGSVFARSDPGKGATFSFSLPSQ